MNKSNLEAASITSITFPGLPSFFQLHAKKSASENKAGDEAIQLQHQGYLPDTTGLLGSIVQQLHHHESYLLQIACI